jgi:hypothetical protein
MKKGSSSLKTNSDSQSLYLNWTKDWLNTYVDDRSKFGSLFDHCHARLEEIRAETATFPTPNPLRTAVFCDIFDKIAIALVPERSLMESIKKELFASIYEGYPFQDFMSAVPYYSKIHDLNYKVQQLSATLEETRQLVSKQSAEIEELTTKLNSTPQIIADAVAIERSKYKTLEMTAVKEKKRADLAEADAEKAYLDLADAEKAMDEERLKMKSEEARFQARMSVAHRIVAEHVPRHQLAMCRAELSNLKSQLSRQGQDAASDIILTPRPNYFRASQYISLSSDGGSKPSKFVVDELCEKLEWASNRYKRIEARLCRRFVHVHPSQVDRFFFEPPDVKGLALESIFCSYAAPSPEPRWRNDAHRARALAACRLSLQQFRDMLRELLPLPRLPADSDDCLRAFRESGSGAPAAGLSFAEFRGCMARLAVIGWAGPHHTHEDLRDLVHDLCEGLRLHDTPALLSRLEALELARCRAAQAAPPPKPKRGSKSR